MKKFSIVAILTITALLVFASFAMAAPGDYSPATTSALYTGQLTTTYTDGAGNSYTPGYSFLNPHAKSSVDPRTVRDAGWSIVNANYTGALNVPYFKSVTDDVYVPALHSTYQRNVYKQLVHTDFQLNTNSCASCHMTHTAQSRKLLFRNGIYSTCAACHDGTLGFLNVFAIPGAGNPFGGSQTAGTFAANKARNASVHLASDSVKLAAAPGGNRMNTLEPGGFTAANNPWAADFNCASCHGPHGSYSIRLLHYNPANIALRPAITIGQEANSGGLWFSSAFLRETSTGSRTFKAYQAATGSVILPRNDAPWIYAYPAGATTGVNALVGRHTRHVTRIWYDGFYNPNTAPTVGGGPMASVNGLGLLNRYFSIKYGKGQATLDADQLAALIEAVEGGFTDQGTNSITGIGVGNFNLANLRIDVGGLVVVTGATRTLAELAALDPTDTPVMAAYSRNFIKTDSYSGKYGTIGANTNGTAPTAIANAYAYNLYCAACHTDYLMGSASGQATAPATNGVGVYSKAFRHTINRGASGGGSMQVKGTGNALLCVSCHYVHGTDSSFMQLADGTRVDGATLTTGTDAGEVNPYIGANDVNHSSALKRYINMSICWTCHANSSAATIKNTDWYWTNYDKDGRGTW